MDTDHDRIHPHRPEATEPFAFISYSHTDNNIVNPYINALTSKCRLWYDESIKIGNEWISEIGNRIFNCEVFIVFLSNNAINSHYIKDEISYAYKFAKKMIAVFLEPVILDKIDKGIDLMINRFQHVENKKEKSTEENIQKILACLPENILLVDPITLSEKSELQPNTNIDPISYNSYASSQIFSDLYSLQRMIGRGGLGEVYSVKSKRTGADYIMKKQHIENENTDQFKVNRSIARNELEKLLLLNDRPYTPVLIDYIEDNENSYLVMSIMPGITLEKLFSETHVFETDAVISLIFKTALILQDIQQHNLVYGDVKPSNLIFNSFGQIGLVDFGTTYAIDDVHYIKALTPHYAAPELLEKDHRGLKFSYDVYALGILFSEFFSKTIIRGHDKKALSDRIIKKMTAISPENRYQTIGEVVAALEMIVPDNCDSILRDFAHSVKTNISFESNTARRPLDTAPTEVQYGDNANDSIYTCVNYTASIPGFWSQQEGIKNQDTGTLISFPYY